MSLRSFISENKLKFGYKDLHTLIPNNGMYYNTLDDALSDINAGGNSKASYVKGNLMSLGLWNTQISEDGYTISGVTFVRDGNTIIANGTATAEISMAIMYSTRMRLYSGKTYRLSGCPAGGSNTTYSLWLTVSNTLHDTGDGVFYTPTEETLTGVYIVVRKGVTVTNAVFNPAVEVCSIDAASFEIFGQKINRNLVDMYSLWNSTNTTVEPDGSMTGPLWAFLADFPLDTYVGSIITSSVKAKITGEPPDVPVNLRLQIYNPVTKTLKAQSALLNERSSTYTLLYASAVVEEGDAVRICYSTGTTANLSKLQIELGAAPTAYKPYEAISEDKDYVSVVRLTKDAVRNETNTVSVYPDNLILDLNGHKLTSSTQIGMNNGTAENSMCFYGLKSGSKFECSAQITIYARNKETFIIGGEYVNNSTSAAGIYIVYCYGANTAGNGGAEYTDSCLYIDSASFETGPDIVATQSSSNFNWLVAAQKIRQVEILNSSVSSVTPSGVVGIYVNSGAVRSEPDTCNIRNVKMNISGTFTDDRTFNGLYLYGGESSTNPLKYEVRDCFFKVTKLNSTVSYGYGIHSVSNSEYSGDPINEYIVNCECYGTVGGIYTQTPNTYIRNCIAGGGSTGLASTSSNINITNSQFKLAYSEIDSTTCSIVEGPISLTRSCNARIDSCKTSIDSYFNSSYNRVFIDPELEASYNKLYTYLSNTKTDNIYVAANSTCYIGENVSNTSNTGSPVTSGGGSIINNSENYSVWSYPKLSYPELIRILSEFRQMLAGKGISIPTILNLGQACNADILTLAEYLTNPQPSSTS